MEQPHRQRMIHSEDGRLPSALSPPWTPQRPPSEKKFSLPLRSQVPRQVLLIHWWASSAVSVTIVSYSLATVS